MTNEWCWNDDGDGTPGGCIRQRISNERTILLKNRTSQGGNEHAPVQRAQREGGQCCLTRRTLEEVLNPMPEASAVFKRLLDWIERAESGGETA